MGAAGRQRAEESFSLAATVRGLQNHTTVSWNKDEFEIPTERILLIFFSFRSSKWYFELDGFGARVTCQWNQLQRGTRLVSFKLAFKRIDNYARYKGSLVGL